MRISHTIIIYRGVWPQHLELPAGAGPGHLEDVELLLGPALVRLLGRPLLPHLPRSHRRRTHLRSRTSAHLISSISIYPTIQKKHFEDLTYLLFVRMEEKRKMGLTIELIFPRFDVFNSALLNVTTFDVPHSKFSG